MTFAQAAGGMLGFADHSVACGGRLDRFEASRKYRWNDLIGRGVPFCRFRAVAKDIG